MWKRRAMMSTTSSKGGFHRSSSAITTMLQQAAESKNLPENPDNIAANVGTSLPTLHLTFSEATGYRYFQKPLGTKHCAGLSRAGIVQEQHIKQACHTQRQVARSSWGCTFPVPLSRRIFGIRIKDNHLPGSDSQQSRTHNTWT